MAQTAFEGFDPDACGWFARLAENNSKAWFEANRATHKAGIAGPMQALMDIAQAQYGGTTKLFRPHRDVRFSKDKSPYNTHQRAAVHGLGPMALYAALDADGFFAGAGVYGFQPARLALFRDVVALEDGAVFAARLDAAQDAGCQLTGETLKTVPRGFDAAHPRAALLRYKSLILGARIGPAAAANAATVEAHARAMWAAAYPVMAWLYDKMGNRPD
ncbi:MAG: DUF2461 domain-containing protein [Pseudomonadota bacterium]